MSKETTIRCNACGKQATGTGYSTLWARLKKSGWLPGRERNTHYCSETCRTKREKE